MVPPGEPGDIAGLADDDGGDDRAHAENLGVSSAGGLDRRRRFLPGLLHLVTGPAQALKKVGCQLAAGLRGSAGRRDLGQDAGGVRRGDPPGHAAGDQPAAPHAAGTPPASVIVPGPGAAWPVPSVPRRGPRR
jgi:hypothetical protein